MLWVFFLFSGRAHEGLRRMMWCFLPFFLGMAVVGNLSEIRVFGEFIPLLALLLASKRIDYLRSIKLRSTQS